MLGALLAQGHDAWTATLGAAWLHGRAGEYGDAGLVASAVAPRAAEALRTLRTAAAATPR